MKGEETEAETVGIFRIEGVEEGLWEGGGGMIEYRTTALP